MKRILALVLVILMAVSAIACGKKEPLTADAFKAAAQAAGLTVEDASETYNDKIFTGAQLAKHADGWQIVFLTIDTVEHAHEYFGIMQKFVEDQKTGRGTAQITDHPNYAMYTHTNDGMFAYVCQIENTMLYIPSVNADACKEAITAFLKTINY